MDSFIGGGSASTKPAGESGDADNTKVEAEKTSAEKLEMTRKVVGIAKNYYEEFLNESDPIERFNKLNTVRAYAAIYPDVLKILGMTKERFDGLVKSVQVQAGPMILDKIQKMGKYERDKAGDVFDLRGIADSLTNNNRDQYYQSLGTSREELQNHLCDGFVAEARGFLSRALNVKADKMTGVSYEFEYKSYLNALAQEMPYTYKQACEIAGRDVYKEVKITDAQIKALLNFKPEIIHEPAPGS